MVKTIKGDLILTKDTEYKESIKVEGKIKGYYNLKVCGNIDCWNIVCWNIDCGNINCRNINCRNIDCWNIVCWNIDCWNIVCCEKIKSRRLIKAKKLIKNRSKLIIKEWK